VVKVDRHPTILGAETDFGQDPCGISPADPVPVRTGTQDFATKLVAVFTVFTIVLYAVTGILTLWSIIETIRNKPADKGLLGAAALLLLLFIVQLILSIATFGSTHDVDPLLFFGYVITAILVVGLAGFWAFAELSRWGPGVLAAAGLTVLVMIERLDQIWQ
jgi:uncharacterized membrane protein YuzA (DUF378 family)